ncbi:MAG: hypothetical protein ACI8QD_001666 [Cyclobacteriaceae bacterium]|jgi:hypothetical protein
MLLSVAVQAQDGNSYFEEGTTITPHAIMN